MSEGFHPDGERRWWEAAHRHIVEARVAATNALAHNLSEGSPMKIFEVLDKLEEADKLTREVMREKGIPCS